MFRNVANSLGVVWNENLDGFEHQQNRKAINTRVTNHPCLSYLQVSINELISVVGSIKTSYSSLVRLVLFIRHYLKIYVFTPVNISDISVFYDNRREFTSQRNMTLSLHAFLFVVSVVVWAVSDLFTIITCSSILLSRIFTLLTNIRNLGNFNNFKPLWTLLF